MSTQLEEIVIKTNPINAKHFTKNVCDRLLGLAAPLFTPSTVGVFLKGRDAAAEVETAAKAWTFAVEMIPSLTEASGRVVVVRNLQPKSKD